MLLNRGLVQLGTCQHCGNDHIPQKVISQMPKASLYVAELQINFEFLELLVEDVDGMVFIQLQKVLKEGPPNVARFFFLCLPHDLVESFNLLLRLEESHQDLLALALSLTERDHLVDYVRLHILLGVLVSRYSLHPFIGE